MWDKAFLLLLAAGLSLQHKPTVGAPWPLPQSWVKEEGYFSIDVQNFRFNATNESCQIMVDAFTRYLALISSTATKDRKHKKPSKAPVGTLQSLDVQLLSPCENYPYLHMKEEYELKICNSKYPKSAALISNSTWGILRGLETFSQLIVKDITTGEVTIKCTSIMDFPRFPHRGLLIDTSRHFLPISVIKENIDLLAINKFNTFHWHIVDDQSFPYESAAYPNLSLEGAWTAEHTYSESEIQGIVNYARDRGIRVVAEFDTPGHVRSWGAGQPKLLTECYTDGKPDGTYGPIDPSNRDNYVFLQTLFTEISHRFPDHYIHVGGDEVDLSCWESNPKITEFMSAQKMTGNYRKLESYYIGKLLQIIHNLPNQNGYVVWEDVFDNGVAIANDTVVHVWKFENDPSRFYPELFKVTKAGYNALLSSCWYLNYISYGVDWQKFYDCDPHGFGGTDEQNKLVLGGEAAMWGEWVDKTNSISRTWPRASTVAERLWSDKNSTTNANAAYPRLAEHRCRMLLRGYMVEPLGPSYCEGEVN